MMAVSILALCLLAGYMQSNLDLVRNAFMRWGARGHLILERPSSDLARQVEGAGQKPLTRDMQSRLDAMLKADDRVAVRARVLRLSGMVSNAGVSTIFSGIGQDVQEIRQIKGAAYEYDVVAGTPLWQDRSERPLIVGQGLAAILGCNVPKVGFAPVMPGQTPESRPIQCPDDLLELTVSTRGTDRINVLRAKPTGIMDWGIKEINDRLVVMPMAQAQALLNTTDVSEYHVLLHDDQMLDAVMESLNHAIRDEGLDVKVFRWSDRATFYQQVRSVLSGFLWFIVIVSIVVCFNSLMNSSYMNFIQRSREFATLRSMGYGKTFVMVLAVLENIWLAAMASVVGILGAVVITWAVRAARLMWTPPGSSNAVPVEIAWTVSFYMFGALMMILLASVAGMLPMRRVVGQQINRAIA